MAFKKVVGNHNNIIVVISVNIRNTVIMTSILLLAKFL